MEHDEVDYERNGTAGSSLKDISVRLSRIEGILNKGAPVLSVEDGVAAFRGHIGKAHRCPENFDHLLKVFGSSFRGRNIATLCPAEVEGFIHKTWGGRKDSTISKRVDQLSAFFNFCIRILKRSGSHGFINPCNLIEKTWGTRVIEDRRGFIDVGRMRDLLGTFADPGQWLLFAILATAGIRVGELLKLRPMDVDGRVLTLMYPKSGKDREYAVVPEIIALRLREYIRSSKIPPQSPIISGTRGAINRLIKRHGRMMGLNITTHDLRRWVATFWERHGEVAMMRFVLRHSRLRDKTGMVLMDPLTARYVSILSVEEAMDRQDRVMVPELTLRENKITKDQNKDKRAKQKNRRDTSL